MFELAGLYPNQRAYVVGKGPSLGNLRAEHIGEGIVIALNQAVAVVERLDIPNMVYSFQKDGCGLHAPHGQCRSQNGVEWMLYPKRAELILQAPGFSEHCLRGYIPKYFVNPRKDLGFERHDTMAVRMGIAMAKQMGCTEIVMVACDSLVNGRLETYDVHQDKAYLTPARHNSGHAKAQVLRELKPVKSSLLIPEPPSASPLSPKFGEHEFRGTKEEMA
jgi:hypothetical protein